MAMGRPQKGETALAHNLKVRIDDKTFRKLVLYCARQGKTRAEVIRNALIAFLDEQL